MVYVAWLVILLIPYWLGPIVVWLTQKAGARPVFEPFTPGRHSVPEDVVAAFRQTCDALTTDGFHVVADLFQTGQMRHVSTRVALLENPATGELALAVGMFTAARPARLVASYAELPTKFRDGRTVSVHNSPLLGSFTPPPSRVVEPLPIVRDPARLCRIKRAYLDGHYRGVERVPFEHQNDPARFLGDAMVRELSEQVGSRVLRTSWTFPSEFVVPAAFPRAVRALERLAGAEATPLVGTDSVGDSLLTEGFAVSVPSARAEALVAAAQPRFLEKGFYLFRSEQHFGIAGRSDRVALFPRNDRYEILRLMGTNGWNYNVGPDSIVAWLRALERDHPFVLTGMGFDWVEGRFRSAIGDADALARRFYAFCPDVVDQGTETVDALAQELRESQRLYCWWD